MAIIIKNVESSGNGGDGVRFSNISTADTDITLDNIKTFGNRGTGLNFTNETTLQKYLSLDDSVETEDIVKIIEEIRLKRHTDQPETIVSKSGLYQKITDASLNFSTFVNNLASIASNPSIQGMFTNT